MMCKAPVHVDKWLHLNLILLSFSLGWPLIRPHGISVQMSGAFKIFNLDLHAHVSLPYTGFSQGRSANVTITITSTFQCLSMTINHLFTPCIRQFPLWKSLLTRRNPHQVMAALPGSWTHLNAIFKAKCDLSSAGSKISPKTGHQLPGGPNISFSHIPINCMLWKECPLHPPPLHPPLLSIYKLMISITNPMLLPPALPQGLITSYQFQLSSSIGLTNNPPCFPFMWWEN